VVTKLQLFTLSTLQLIALYQRLLELVSSQTITGIPKIFMNNVPSKADLRYASALV
jgi:hypothetical protein